MTDAPNDGAADPLDALCDLLGVQRRYEASGGRHEAPRESVAAALRELGAPLAPGGVVGSGGRRAEPGSGAVEDALRATRLERWQRVVEPVAVSWEGAPPAVDVRVLDSESRDGLELRVVLEGGGVAERRVPANEVEWLAGETLEGRAFRRGRVPLPRLPRGWHDVTVRAGSREGSARVVRAPSTTWDGPGEDADPAGPAWRSWGAFLPLYALRSERDRGAGDLADLDALARRVREWGGDFVGTLPLLPTFLGGREGAPRPGVPVEPSPYVPVSRLFWNELYLDVEHAPGLEDAPDARAVLESAAHREEAARLRATDRVDHAEVMAHKRRVLEPLAAAVAGDAAGTGLAGALEAFVRETPGAVEYARFRAYAEEAGTPWPGWSGEAAGGTLAPDAASPRLVAYHLYVQWAMAEGMAALADGPGADLYLDLPLGCHPLGYDVWRHRDAFATGMSGGAPPDAFFAGGQDWGFPPLHPVRSRERGHAYFAASLRHLMGACSMLRLDHVMSLHRLFWVPDGGSPADGVYVRYPSEELWATLCLESRRAECEVVGEDLGTVPPEVPEAMERRGARRMWVLPFEVGPVTSAAAGAGKEDAEGHERVRASTPPARSVASLNTHDMPPFASFWEAGDVDRRVESGHLDPDRADAEREERARWAAAVASLVDRTSQDPPTEDDASGPAAEPALAADVLPGVLDLLARSPARLVLVNLEDLWGEERPQNRPGTAGPENWTLRAARTLEEMADDGRVVRLLRRLDRLRDAPDDTPDDTPGDPADTADEGRR